MVNHPPVDIRSDMLTLTSTVQEVLRALYLYGVDYIMLLQGKNERLLHKEQLVALLEKGRDKATLEDIPSMALKEPLSAVMRIEDIPASVSMLLFTVIGDTDRHGELDKMTFEAFREKKIADSAVIFPDWWSVPLPLVHIEDDRVFLNQQGERTIPGGAPSLANQIERMRTERIVSIREKKAERTFSLSPLTEDTFLAEDISGDFEMAEDLVWWAAIGKAFVGRMKKNGLGVKRLSPYEDPPADAAEVIQCSWEGELIGKLAIEVPGETAEDGEKAPSSKRAEEKEPEKQKRQKAPKKPKESITPIEPIEIIETVEAKEQKEPEFSPPPTPVKSEKKSKSPAKTGGKSLKAVEVEFKEPEPQSINMKKTAARSAYGLKGKSPAAKSKEVNAAESIGNTGSAEKIEKPDAFGKRDKPDKTDKAAKPAKAVKSVKKDAARKGGNAAGSSKKRTDAG